MNIGIIGNGFVGKAIKESFKNYYEVESYCIIGDGAVSITKPRL